MQFHVSHIYREGNQAANYLASRALSLEVSSWWSSAPDFVAGFVQKDSNGWSSFRFC